MPAWFRTPREAVLADWADKSVREPAAQALEREARALAPADSSSLPWASDRTSPATTPSSPVRCNGITLTNLPAARSPACLCLRRTRKLIILLTHKGFRLAPTCPSASITVESAPTALLLLSAH